MPLDHQEVRFALRNIGKRDAAQIYINDKPFQEIIGEDEFFWPIQRGQFKFYVKKGNLVSNVVKLQVR